jgi:hypothetical protein
MFLLLLPGAVCAAVGLGVVRAVEAVKFPCAGIRADA